MRSSEAARRRHDRIAWLLVALAAAAIGLIRPRIAERFHKLRVTADVYPFAPPDQMVIASLGYRSALADAIFAHVLVSYGLHTQEHRRMEFVGDYLDTVNALDPKFRDPYRYADSLVVMSPEPARLSDYLRARKILERGLANRPYDTELWSTAGQFIAYLAVPFLPVDKKEAWRLDGARILARACELASGNANIPYHCIAAASLFEKAGEREAAVESLRRLAAVTDDPEIERIADGYAVRLRGDKEKAEDQIRRKALRDAWKGDLPYVSKDLMLVIGPHADTARCAGADHALSVECATNFRDFSRQFESGEN